MLVRRFYCWKRELDETLLLLVLSEFLTSQRWLGNIHLSWDVVINSIRLGGLICSSKSFLQLNKCQELHISAFVSMYVFGCKLSLVRLCDSDFGITLVDNITIGITCAAFCFHIALFHSPILGTCFVCRLLFWRDYVYSGQLCLSKRCSFVFLFVKVMSGR